MRNRACDETATAVPHGCSILIRRKGRRFKKLDAALDTSATIIAICVIDGRDGSIVFAPTDPEAIFLKPHLPRLQRVVHEATSWSACTTIGKTRRADEDGHYGFVVAL